MKKLATVLAMTGALLVGGGAVAQAVPLQEDDPGWNCLRDGNKVCGLEYLQSLPLDELLALIATGSSDFQVPAGADANDAWAELFNMWALCADCDMTQYFDMLWDRK